MVGVLIDHLPVLFPRSPRKGLFSPKNLVANSSRQVFGFDAPISSTPSTTAFPFGAVYTSPTTQHPHDHDRHGPVITNGVHTSSAISVPNTYNDVDYSYAADGPFHENGRTNSKTGYAAPSEKSDKTISSAISTKSFHTNRKISPPINRPEHLRFT